MEIRFKELSKSIWFVKNKFKMKKVMLSQNWCWNAESNPTIAISKFELNLWSWSQNAGEVLKGDIFCDHDRETCYFSWSWSFEYYKYLFNMIFLKLFRFPSAHFHSFSSFFHSKMKPIDFSSNLLAFSLNLHLISTRKLQKLRVCLEKTLGIRRKRNLSKESHGNFDFML